VLALNLLPFAGLAFLWFIGVVRDRIGEGEDRFFATVFLGSGLLFIAMLFATGAIAGGLMLTGDQGPNPDVWSFGRRVTYTLLTVYAMRMPRCSPSPRPPSPSDSDSRRAGSPSSGSAPAASSCSRPA
jgi:hypothetical protein